MIGTADGKQYEDGFDYLVQSRGLAVNNVSKSDKLPLSDRAAMNRQAQESINISEAVRNFSTPMEPPEFDEEAADIHFERMTKFLNAVVDPEKFNRAMEKYPEYNPNVKDVRGKEDPIGSFIRNFMKLPPQQIRKTSIMQGDKPIIDVGPAPGGPGGGYPKPANENIRPGLDPYDKAVAGQKLEQTGKKIEGPLPEARPAVKQLEINPADYKKAINPGDLKSVSPPEGYYDKIEATRFGGTGISHPGYRHEVYDRETGDKIGTFSSSFRAARKIADTEEGSSRYQQIMVKANRLTPKETKFLKDNNLYEEYTNGPKPIRDNPARRLLEDPEMMKKFEEFLKQIKGYPKPE